MVILVKLCLHFIQNFLLQISNTLTYVGTCFIIWVCKHKGQLGCVTLCTNRNFHRYSHPFCLLCSALSLHVPARGASAGIGGGRTKNSIFQRNAATLFGRIWESEQRGERRVAFQDFRPPVIQSRKDYKDSIPCTWLFSFSRAKCCPRWRNRSSLQRPNASFLTNDY